VVSTRNKRTPPMGIPLGLHSGGVCTRQQNSNATVTGLVILTVALYSIVPKFNLRQSSKVLQVISLWPTFDGGLQWVKRPTRNKCNVSRLVKFFIIMIALPRTCLPVSDMCQEDTVVVSFGTTISRFPCSCLPRMVTFCSARGACDQLCARVGNC